MFLKSIGTEHRKVGHIPAGTDIEAQETFKKRVANASGRSFCWSEKLSFSLVHAHFVLAPFSGFLWSYERVFIKAPAGRKRFNVLVALNAITHELILMSENDTRYINAQTICRVAKAYGRAWELRSRLRLVLDNTQTYQKCHNRAGVGRSDSKLSCFSLPPYSPKLNLIERLWKFIRKKCLYSKYYDDFSDFKRAISDCLDQTHTTYKSELDTLLTLNFQTFEIAQVPTT